MIVSLLIGPLALGDFVVYFNISVSEDVYLKFSGTFGSATLNSVVPIPNTL